MASLASMRRRRDSLDISSEKTATTLLIFDGAVLRDVDGPGGLAHGGAGGNDDEFGVLEAARHLVELDVVGGEAGDFPALLVERVDGAEGAGDDFGDVGEAALDGAVGYFS